MKKKLLFIYEYFTPATKAGGIVSSLKHLANLLEKDYQVFVYTSSYDANGEHLEIESNQWVNDHKFSVYYATGGFSKKLKRVVEQVEPDICYFNGLYNVHFVFKSLLEFRFNQKPKPEFWLCPRGMLQAGALKVKPLKKRVYLFAFKLLRLHRMVRWHATDDQEMKDIVLNMGQDIKVKLAYDTPGDVSGSIVPIVKKSGSLRLCFLSLITEKKNLKGLLIWLQNFKAESCINLDIYGPVKDTDYWRTCEKLISKLPERVKCRYGGEVKPHDVVALLNEYHFLILPSLGENFGHVIYESLSVGRPVMISDNTPWTRVVDWKAGFVNSVDEPGNWLSAMDEALQLDQTEYDQYVANARALAKNYLEVQNLREQYNQLFG